MKKQEPSFKALIEEIIFEGLDEGDISTNLVKMQKVWDATSESNLIKGLQLLVLLDESVKLTYPIISKLITNILSGNDKIKRASIGVLTSYYALRPFQNFRKHEFSNKILAEVTYFPKERLNQALSLKNSDLKNYVLGTILSRSSKLEDYNVEIRAIPKATLLNQLKQNEDEQICNEFETYWNEYQSENQFEIVDVYRDQILRHLLYKKEVQFYSLEGILIELKTDNIPLDDLDTLRESFDLNQSAMLRSSMSSIQNILRNSRNIKASQNFGLTHTQIIPIIQETPNLIQSNNSTTYDDAQIIEQSQTNENDN